MHSSRLSKADSSAMWSYPSLSKVVTKVRNDNFKMNDRKRPKFRKLKFTNIETVLYVEAAGFKRSGVRTSQLYQIPRHKTHKMWYKIGFAFHKFISLKQVSQ